MLTKRGVLIVLEGCDKTGKSTHTKLLTDAFKKLQIPSQLITFPDRSTATGQIIDKYLKCQVELPDQAIHLLFSTNRWESVPKIQQLITNGTNVILDRYAFSGVAFTAAKGSLDLQWCKNPDIGLPKPDRVIYLTCNEKAVSQRTDYGKERYENNEFQDQVKQKYLELKEDSFWKVVDTGRPVQEVHNDILTLALETLKQVEESPLPLAKLWV